MTKVFKFIYVIIKFSLTLISHKKVFKFVYVIINFSHKQKLHLFLMTFEKRTY